jgi:hypothetical protein
MPGRGALSLLISWCLRRWRLFPSGVCDGDPWGPCLYWIVLCVFVAFVCSGWLVPCAAFPASVWACNARPALIPACASRCPARLFYHSLPFPSASLCNTELLCLDEMKNCCALC